VSERQACRVLQQWRGMQRYVPLYRTEEDTLTQNIITLKLLVVSLRLTEKRNLNRDLQAFSIRTIAGAYASLV